MKSKTQWQRNYTMMYWNGTGVYRRKAVIVPTAEGDRDMIDTGRESVVDDGLTVRQWKRQGSRND